MSVSPHRVQTAVAAMAAALWSCQCNPSEIASACFTLLWRTCDALIDLSDEPATTRRQLADELGKLLLQIAQNGKAN